MSPKLHLYLTPGSCSLASHIALNESGLDFTITVIPLGSGFPAERLHLNPKGRVPILDFDGELITESPAILSAISALVPSKNLLGSSALEHARAQEWLAWLCGTLHGQAFGCLFRPNRFVEDEKLIDAVRARGRAWVQESFQYVEEKLEGRTHAVGEAFTVVDAYLLVFYRWGNRSKLEMRKNFPNYAKLVDEVIKRETVKKTLEVEQMSPLNE